MLIRVEVPGLWEEEEEAFLEEKVESREVEDDDEMADRPLRGRE